jgi:hypothetical protein
MIRVEENKLIIEIETNMPLNELQDIQAALLDAIKHYDGEAKSGTIYELANLLNETVPTFEQNKAFYNCQS